MKAPKLNERLDRTIGKLLLGFALTWMFTASAATILIQAPESRTLDYRATLLAHPELLSPTQQIFRSRPTSSNREKLILLFAAAQKAFLENSPLLAKEKFNAVLAQTLEDDWNDADYGLFLFSYFRLAQLASDPGERDKWLSQSLLLGQPERHMVQAQYKQIPPPLIKRREELRNQVPSTILSRPSPEDWSEVLINGRPCGIKDCGRWPRHPGPVRITFISDQWQTQTLVSDLEKWKRLQPKRIALASGTCASPETQMAQLQFRKPTHSLRVFWSLECDSGKPLQLAVSQRPSVPNTSLPELDMPEANPKFYQSPWFWTGVGVAIAAAAIAIKENQRGRDSGGGTEPTTGYGFR